MTDNEIIKALECCSDITFRCDGCPLQHLKYSECYELVTRSTLDLINRQKAEIEQITEKFNCQQTVYADLSKIIKEQAVEIKRLTAFKSYFDELYGKGLDIANWHKNGDLEPFDNFYDSALEEMEGDTK